MNTKKIQGFVTENAIYIVLAVLLIGIAVYDPSFIGLNTLRDILIQSSTRVIIALGVAFILITGGTDLSAGRMVGLTAVVSASMLQEADYARRFFPNLPELPLFVPVLIAIAVGLVFGLINGIIVSKFKVPPFIATLGTMVAIYGINSLYFDTEPNQSQPIGGLRGDFTTIGSGSLFGNGNSSIPYIVLIAIAVCFIVWVLFNKTRLGKNMYAIGGNEQAAKVSGINVARNLILIYSIAGALYGLAGVLEAARTGGATNNYGNMYELDAIAACVVGGVSTTGGIGTVPGIMAGVLIFTVINYGLTFVGVGPYWQQIIKGAIIVAAVAFDMRKYASRK
ncbi:galactose/methyl galactoside ABC transporter permease MglC [Paenibacillus macerans]|uniref:Branched-chain amino acid transport system / permease component family protein n=1 Tax=Paenibacillus macerans TaxID=44252 RepID=A0A090YB21_PAEMA|nr:galactose/methyl galactoside ABC transporter permease MglC [Paenibacillus macerans]KFM95391.1 branched-chain amino acid transport system / permease component family protein [Paenibacillus macerans]MBS5915085.1 galactose/methyl galactoside ABC transporter permease MglC [Paenibacillus macerans]MCY7561377.1 galactose/methyl galactoside ABC transporter permease MglC [Paenibacillus macerans]MDU5947496.1 galactose/methyl galactoside ABC transporter permease MglC [Paenibacillus macerans]MEC0140812